MKKMLVLAGLALGLAVAVPMTAVSEVKMGEGPAAKDALAPDIQVQDTIGGDGRLSLADYRGEVVFLEIWATH